MGCSASIGASPETPSKPPIAIPKDQPVSITQKKTVLTETLVTHQLDSSTQKATLNTEKIANTTRAHRSGPACQDLLVRSNDIKRSTAENTTSIEDLIRIYSGDLNYVSSISCNKSQVRIFTSSTFVDFKDWRNKLMEDVYPFLHELCGILGLEFSVVDMRWGVRESAADDHGTAKLCMQEISRCQALSLGINFVSFLGCRYGYRPFPATIPAPEFSILIANVSDLTTKELLLLWFRIDSNRLNPAVHRLQPVSSVYPDFKSSDPTKQRAASGKWWADFEAMQLALRSAAVHLPDGSKFKRLFTISVTHEEVLHGILENDRKNDEVLVFTRSIDTGCPWPKLRYKADSKTDPDNIKPHDEEYICPENADMLRSFADWKEPQGDLDLEAYSAQMQLINKELPDSGTARFIFVLILLQCCWLMVSIHHIAM
jgi:hypothetical protein